ncbi:MAG: FtsK/SpoIIIE domain-containing protein [Acidimicrobiales bacterium]
MRILVRTDSTDHVVEVTGDTTQATVGDLLDRLGIPADQVTIDDGPPVDRDAVLRSLVAGAAVDTRARHPRIDGSPHAGCDATATFDLVVSRGPDAGTRIPVAAGRGVVIGRDPSCDLVVSAPDVSRRHCRIVAPDPDATTPAPLEDLGAVMATVATPTGRAGSGRDPIITVDLGCGRVILITRRSQRSTPPVPDAVGRIPRPLGPGRAAGPPSALPLHADPGDDGDGRRRATWAGVVASLVVGAVLAIFVSPMMALFALFAPAMALATWVENRQRGRADTRRVGRLRRAAHQSFAATAARAHRAEMLRRRRGSEVPDVLAEITAGGPTMWAASCLAEARIAVGWGNEPWIPDVIAPRGAEPLRGGDEVIDGLGPLRDVPTAIDLGAGPVAVVGPAELARRVLRWIVIQAAASVGPDQLRIAVPHRSEWTWARWLPHTGTGRHGESPVLRLVDHTGHGGDPGGRGPTRPADATVVASESTVGLPADCTTIVTILDGRGVARVDEADRTRWTVVDGLGRATAGDAARSMARWLVDADVTAEPPATVEPCDLGLPEADRDAVLATWSAGTSPAPRVPFGHDGTEVVVLDLDRDGPHVLVTGTTGSGKSGLLRMLVAGLAATHPPDTVTFALLDFKGGSTFDDLVPLPHVGSVITDLDGTGADRAFRCLTAEIRRREEVLRSAGRRDMRDLPSGVEPRLVVVMDELATLLENHPDFGARLVDIARRGRSLGIHLILSTQRAAGVIAPAVRANVAARMTLRVLDPADSLDTVGDPLAARFAAATPGRVAIATPDRTLRVAQCASPDPVTEVDDVVRIRLDDVRPVSLRERIEAIVATGAGRARQLVPPPLPDHLSPAALDEAAGSGSADGAAVAIGLADRPDGARRTIVSWQWETDNLLVSGVDVSARSRVLVAAVTAVAAHRPPAECSVVTLDTVGAMTVSLDALPHSRGHFRTDPIEGPVRVLASLDPRARPTGPPTILVVDDLPALVADLEAHRRGDLIAALHRIVANGATAGVTVAATAQRPGAVPRRLIGAFATSVVLGPDPEPDGPGGRRRTACDDGTRPGARGSIADDGVEVQMLEDPVTVAPAPGDRPDRRIRLIPEIVDVVDLGGASIDGAAVTIPLGRRGGDGGVVSLRLRPGTHAVVAGPARSGRSTTLATLAGVLAKGGVRVLFAGEPPTIPQAHLIAAGRDIDEMWAAADRRVDTTEVTAVLVDDAALLGDTHGLLERLTGVGGAVHVVAVVRSDRRELRGSWLDAVVDHATGVLLAPDAVSADMFGVRDAPVPSGAPARPGRGWVVEDGHAVEVQIASLVADPGADPDRRELTWSAS